MYYRTFLRVLDRRIFDGSPVFPYPTTEKKKITKQGWKNDLQESL